VKKVEVVVQKKPIVVVEENVKGVLYRRYGYIGEYKNGEYHGQGTFTWSNGRKYEGEWKDGKMWKGTEYDKNGNYVWKYVNGEIE